IMKMSRSNTGRSAWAHRPGHLGERLRGGGTIRRHPPGVENKDVQEAMSRLSRSRGLSFLPLLAAICFGVFLALLASNRMAEAAALSGDVAVPRTPTTAQHSIAQHSATQSSSLTVPRTQSSVGHVAASGHTSGQKARSQRLTQPSTAAQATSQVSSQIVRQ